MGDVRLLETFLALARIASPAFGESEVASFAAAELRAAGAEVRFDDSSSVTGSDTGNVIAVLPATGRGRTVVLCAHMDTVGPCEGVEPVVEDGVVRSAGDTVLGADDKAGIAAILETVRRLAEADVPHPEVRVVLTVAEEKGLVGAKALQPSDIAGDLCVVLDAEGAPGGIVLASPTHYMFTATFRGRAAHAGVEPERGASALLMAARAVSAMPFGRIDEETTANIGRIEGGMATNVVTPSVVVAGECRSRDAEKVEEVRARMQTAMEEAAASLGGSVDAAWSLEYEAFRFEPDDPVLALGAAALADAGLEPRLFETGGGSDGNILTAKGVPTLVLSSGMRDVHTADESIAVEDLETLVRVLGAIVARAGS